jgi:hypothetical protein
MNKLVIVVESLILWTRVIVLCSQLEKPIEEGASEPTVPLIIELTILLNKDVQ